MNYVIKRSGVKEEWHTDKIKKTIKWAIKGIPKADPLELENKLSLQLKETSSSREIISSLKNSAVDLISLEEPYWDLVAGRIAMMDFNKEVRYNVADLMGEEVHQKFGYNGKMEKFKWMVSTGRYGSVVYDKYTEAELQDLLNYIDEDRDQFYTYSSVQAMKNQYVMRTGDNKIIELPQEMYMAIAIYVSIPEADGKRVEFAKEVYDLISEQYISPATPSVTNLRKPNGSGTSCEVVMSGDSLDQISHMLTQIKRDTSKGTGFGAYLGKVRCGGSEIRGIHGVAGGTIPYIKEINSVIVATDQLGVRDGNIGIYQDIWHADVVDFVNDLKAEHGDQRSKAHDVFRGLNIPNLFWERKNNREDFTLMDPYEIKKILGYDLCDVYGKEWEDAYKKLEKMDLKTKVVINARKFWIDILKKLPEEGDPYIFFRDRVNEVHPNKHVGPVYASNLCTEIASIFTPDSELLNEIINTEDGVDYLDQRRELGYATTCNLASINLGKLPNEPEKRQRIMAVCMRFLDNVVTITKNANPSATKFNRDFRATGIGYIGNAYFLAKNKLSYGSADAIKFLDDTLKELAYYALDESANLAKEKGAYPMYEGSEWSKGIFFGRPLSQLPKQYTELYEKMKRNGGLRNGYIFATAPNTSTSVLLGTTPSIYPIKNLIVEKEGKAGNIISIVPEVDKYQWYYRSTNQVTYEEYIKTIAVFQKWTDQAISNEVFFNPDIHTPKDLYNFYELAYDHKLKTVYYCKVKRVNCDSCAN